MKLLMTGGSGFIGTNAVGHFLEQGREVLNLDARGPFDPAHNACWRQCDIMDRDALAEAFREFAPDEVVHMAARAECDETTTVEEGYAMNTAGTQNVLDAIRATPSVRRAVIVSSQFVCGPGYQPANDEDFHPVTVYGQSKVITEQLTRQADLPCCWTLVRPTNIWGPWHFRYRDEFWKMVQKGLYVHPGGRPVVRCYGYVGNVVAQMRRILELPDGTVNGQVFYLGDAPADIRGWVNAFSLALKGRKATEVPRWVLAALGLGGDMIGMLTGKPFYITSSRYRSMTSDYIVNMDKSFEVLGQPPVSLEDGVKATVEWLRTMEGGHYERSTSNV